MEEIEVIIDTDGSSKVSVKGVKGGECTKLTAPFTQGADVSDNKPTSEFYEQTQSQQQRLQQ
jgi:hypothetical protein